MADDATEKWFVPRRRVYLMRHGEVEYFTAEGRALRPERAQLNADGRRQAEAAGRALADVPLDLALSSGLDRAAETARLVLGERPVPLVTDPRWREIETGQVGDLPGATPQAVERAVLGALPPSLSPDDRFLAGETFASLRERVTAAWGDLLGRPDWKSSLVVAHGIANRTLLSHLLGAGLAAIGALEQDAGCINLIEVGADGRCLVRLLNFTPGNPAKRGMDLSTLEGLYRQYLRSRPPAAP
jgi:probable phosphoglycerate mutase